MGKTCAFTHSYPQVIHKLWIKLCNLESYPRGALTAESDQGEPAANFRQPIDGMHPFFYNKAVTCIVSYNLRTVAGGWKIE